jgi:hypothetical protein
MHNILQGDLALADNQVVMVAHNDVAEKVEFKPGLVVFKQLKEKFLVGVVLKDKFPVVAPLYDMVNTTGIF